MNQAYQVKIDSFEGPLDLLLHLINRYEIDIYDIPVAQITEQYMEYIHTMQQLELNIASEYLVMAATLLALKSQMLLPKQEMDTEEDDYAEDPRDELMGRLIEYRKYKQAAENLKEKEMDANQIFTRSPVVFDDIDLQQPVVQGDISIYEMLGALGKMLERKKWKEPMETTIKRIEISIEERMEEVIQVVKNAQAGVSFDHLFSYRSRSHIVVTFMALLELMKNKAVYCEQEKQLETLYVFYMGENE
ncbi:segregation/condensation protein A [Virgibacillus dakarensis]|uniref:segregation/condensation protein A n=1 Tax=Virgibacillus dakarensis TaxID=1917889 RepID=UPI000B436152|nr:segregation/condensation protein A [Virgibacillus dakarensis]MBT2214313.1 segregation/condensation protein A [Virgibacillus dakarensis]MTW84990.1 segregation/condensation protein A [Virgibacillus dakarensis]